MLLYLLASKLGQAPKVLRRTPDTYADAMHVLHRHG